MNHESVMGIGEIALDLRIRELETALGSDVIAIVGPIMFGLEHHVRREIEHLVSMRKDGEKKSLVVVLDTAGGVVEIVERMVDTIRQYYDDVRFAIPDRAMSAGTIFAMSGDAILMDYFSVLGPIDPQVAKDGRLTPAQAYIDEYERLVVAAKNGNLTTADIVLLQKLDLGEIRVFREAKELSVELLQKWLAKYKFKDWTVTRTSQTPVDDNMRSRRAKEIAEQLGDQRRWHSHGRGISRKTLQDELRLEIDDLGSNKAVVSALKAYFNLLQDLIMQKSLPLLVHTRATH